jgi:transcriptional regulator GlxA family with amidase domain
MSATKFSKEEKERIYHVKAFILHELSKQWTVKQLARRAAMGQQKLQEGFYWFFEMSVGCYVRTTRLQAARFLVSHTDRTIKEICGLCGYKDYKSFLKAYKKHFGISAAAERKQRKG